MADLVLQSPKNPHFFQPLLPGFHSHLNIPVTFFVRHLQGKNEHKTAKLRSDASGTVWEVEIDDGRRFTSGWKEFVTAHDFRIGDVIVFRHEGDLAFHVTALGPSCCELEYKFTHNINDDDQQDNIDSETRPVKKRAKKNPVIEKVLSSSDNSCFEANVSVSNLKEDRLYIPLSFARSNGLNKNYGKIVLLNEKGRSWKLSLNHDKAGVNTFIKHGWRSFCNANGMNIGRYTFKLVQNSGIPVIRLCQAEYRPYSKSSPGSSCFMGSVTTSSLLKDSLYLPREFVNSNGLKKTCGEIVLKNENGGTWNLVLRYYESKDTTILSCGWRSFCQDNKIKARDCFKFKLVRTGEKPVLCLCPVETKTRLVESSEAADVTSLSTSLSSREESSETEESKDKNTIKDDDMECSNIEKWKYCSRPGASSSSSSRQNRFVTLTITPSCFRSNRMRLPFGFTRDNGINKIGNITMLAQDGVKWTVRIMKDDKVGRLRLGRDWKGFCEVHGIKTGDSFVLECIWKKDGSPVLKFCNKVICV